MEQACNYRASLQKPTKIQQLNSIVKLLRLPRGNHKDNYFQVNTFHCLLFIIIVTFFAADTKAQGVTIHSDPRLLLLKKKAPEKPPREKNRLIANASIPVGREVPFSHAAASAGAKNGISAPAANTHPVAAAAANKAAAGAAHTAAGPIGPPPPSRSVVSPPPRFNTERLTSLEKARVIYSGKGFRVQIYNGNDRNKAVEIKMEFARRYPAVRTYLCYVSPSFRVKVGDYRNRSDAEGMYREAKSMYSPCMIVPDIVTISTY